MSLPRVAFFVSGGGTDMQSVLDAIERGELEAKPVYVVSTRGGVYALERAKSAGVPFGVFERRDFASAEERDAAIIKALKAAGGADLIILAGYLGVVTPVFVREYAGRIINIHPSLIPKHCGKGFYGARVHEAVIAAGDKLSGATVHYVDEGVDTGEIILQGEVPVMPEDTPETLQQRVLELEHKLLPQAVAVVLNKLLKEE